MQIIGKKSMICQGKASAWLILLFAFILAIFVFVFHAFEGKIFDETETSQEVIEAETGRIFSPDYSIQKSNTNHFLNNKESTLSDKINIQKSSTSVISDKQAFHSSVERDVESSSLVSVDQVENKNSTFDSSDGMGHAPSKKEEQNISFQKQEFKNENSQEIEKKKSDKIKKKLTNNNTTDNSTPERKPKQVVSTKEDVLFKIELPEIKDDTGAFTQRTILGRHEATQLSGGSLESENAVDLALAWLAVHQESDGHWDSAKYGGLAFKEYDLAVTGVAVLAFLSAGQTDIKGEWNISVKSALQWLMDAQKKDGSFDRRNYTNGICTMALCEAAAMGCGGDTLKRSAVLAIDYILKQQNTSGFFDYVGITKRNDMSVTGWCITALKSGTLAGIKRKEIADAYEKTKIYFDIAEDLSDVTPESKGLAWYVPGTRGSGAVGGACQAIAMFVRQQIGGETEVPTTWLLAAANGQISRLPLSYLKNANVYRIYYSYLALRQLGGNYWNVWNQKVSPMIINAQRQDGDFRGSWDPNNSSIEKAGRVMYTAMLCLCLEIYYRYPTVF